MDRLEVRDLKDVGEALRRIPDLLYAGRANEEEDSPYTNLYVC